MGTLLLSVLPQILILAGIAGMAWIVARYGFPWGQVISPERVRTWVESARETAVTRGLVAVERGLRKAKIFSMRFEQFLAGRLEALAKNKKAGGAPATGAFWKNIRERTITLAKPRRKRPAIPETHGNIVLKKDGTEGVLMRITKDEKNGSPPA